MINMSIDSERLEEFLLALADKYTGIEIVEILELSEWDIIEAFRDQIVEARKRFEL